MREIKFRAWHTLDKRWLEIYYLKPQNNGLWVISGNGYGYSPQEIELMQSTGLHDKNGVEIFEGDIINYRDSELLTIVWVDVSARFALKSQAYSAEWTIDDRFCEVIGNIYENPELLEK